MTITAPDPVMSRRAPRSASCVTQRIREPRLGHRARWALRQPIRGRKKHKTLVLIAAYSDAGIADPSIRELSARSGIPKFRVVQIVDALASAGYLAIERPKDFHDRNQYALTTKGG